MCNRTPNRHRTLPALLLGAVVLVLAGCSAEPKPRPTMPRDTVVAVLAELRRAALTLEDDSFPPHRDSILALHDVTEPELRGYMEGLDPESLATLWQDVSRTVVERPDSARTDSVAPLRGAEIDTPVTAKGARPRPVRPKGVPAPDSVFRPGRDIQPRRRFDSIRAERADSTAD